MPNNMPTFDEADSASRLDSARAREVIASYGPGKLEPGTMPPWGPGLGRRLQEIADPFKEETADLLQARALEQHANLPLIPWGENRFKIDRSALDGGNPRYFFFTGQEQTAAMGAQPPVAERFQEHQPPEQDLYAAQVAASQTMAPDPSWGQFQEDWALVQPTQPWTEPQGPGAEQTQGVWPAFPPDPDTDFADALIVKYCSSHYQPGSVLHPEERAWVQHPDGQVVEVEIGKRMEELMSGNPAYSASPAEFAALTDIADLPTTVVGEGSVQIDVGALAATAALSAGHPGPAPVVADPLQQSYGAPEFSEPAYARNPIAAGVQLSQQALPLTRDGQARPIQRPGSPAYTPAGAAWSQPTSQSRSQGNGKRPTAS